MKIQIPATIGEAVKSLDALGELLTAKGWERAAIVYAYTEEGQHGRGKTVSNDSLSFEQFAAFGIHGLKSKNTVQRYHERWAEHGDLSIAPGDTVTLPAIDWPPIESRPNTHRVGAMKPEALADHIAARDDVETVIERVAEKRYAESVRAVGQATLKSTQREAKEHEAAEHVTGTKRHTDAGTAEFLLHAHAAVSQSKLVAAYLETHNDLELTDTERRLIREAHDEIVASWAAIYLAVSNDIMSELEAT